MKRTILFSVISLIVILFSCNRKSSKEENPENLPPDIIEMNAAQMKLSGITFGKAGIHEMKNTLQVNGVIGVNPMDVASVSFLMGGFIQSTRLVPGSTVKKGDVLAEISNLEFIQLQQDYLETKAKFEYAEIEFKRHSALFKENVYSEKNVQQVETEYKTLKSRLHALEQKLILLGILPQSLTDEKISGTLQLKAPIDGYVKTVNVSIGKYVNPSDVLFEIVNPDHVNLQLVIFEKDIQKVKTGLRLLFSTPDHPEKKYSGVVFQAGRVLDNDKTTNAYARIENPDETLLSGMYVNAKLETATMNVVAVPAESVVRFNSKYYLFVYDSDKKENGKDIRLFRAIEVTTGITGDGFTQVTSVKGEDLLLVKIAVHGAYAILSAWKNAGEMAC
ncbi:MAG: efflux RND transporter periplasmic adaptor subunit [Bacteroidota bacterium]